MSGLEELWDKEEATFVEDAKVAFRKLDALVEQANALELQDGSHMAGKYHPQIVALAKGILEKLGPSGNKAFEHLKQTLSDPSAYDKNTPSPVPPWLQRNRILGYIYTEVNFES